MFVRKLAVTGMMGVLLTMAAPGLALNINLDYTTDTSSFFTSNPTAKVALEAAAADLGSAITTVLTATHDVDSSTVNGSSASFNYRFNYTHPTTGAGGQVYNPAVVAADTVNVFVGARNLAGPLGEGGPGGAGVSSAGSISNPSDFATAVDNAEAAGNANLGRGGGPIIGTLSGSLGVEAYAISYGSAIGNLWFDSVGVSWHYDHTTAVGFNDYDFYSVALHELIHAIGFSSAESYQDLQTGNDWSGAEVIALLGTGTNILEADGKHILNGTKSARLSDGLLQDAAMDPSLTNGQRKSLTQLDLAFLRDIGWDTVSAPAVLLGDANNDGVVSADDFAAVQTNFGNTGAADGLLPGDANDDGVVSADDFAAIQTNFGNVLGAAAQTAPIPEPATIALIGLGGVAALRRRAA